MSNASVAHPTLTIPANTTTYTLTITDDDGCTATDQVTVTVLPTPQALLTSTGPEQIGTFNGLTTFSICDPAGLWSFGFQDQSAPYPGSVLSLDWGDGSPVVNPTQGWALSHDYPAGLHTITYTITYPNGCSHTRQYHVFLGTNPGGGISTDPNTNICSGGTLPFYINNVAANSPGTTYIINFGDGQSVTLTHPPPAVVTHTYSGNSCGAPGGQYWVSFTAQNPCDATQGQIGPIRVSQTPQAQFTMNPNGAACVNQTVIFSDQSLGQQAPSCQPPKHIWSISPAAGWTVVSGSLGNVNGQPNNPGLWTSGSNNLGVQFSAPGTYSISDVTGNSCGFDTLTQTICIEQAPTPAFTLSQATGCAPLQVTTSNLSTSPNSCNTTFQWNVTASPSVCGSGPAWSFTGGTGANSFEPTFQFAQPGTYTVTLVATNACGSFPTAQQVTVNAPPQVSLAPLSGICAGQCVNPSATVTDCGAAITTYAWTFPGGTPASSNTASPGQVCFASAGTPTLSLTVTNACGSATANANLAVGTVPPAPVVSSNSPVCVGQTISLTAAAIPGITYLWTGPNGFTANQPAVTIANASTAHAGTYTVVALSAGCQSAPVSVNVQVVPAPAISIAPASTAVCAGQSATLSASGGNNYEWYIGSTLVGTGPSITTSPAVTTTYTVTGYAGGCPGSATATVTVYPLPVINAGPPQSLCDQAIPVQLSATPAPGTWSGPIVTPSGQFTPIPDSLGTFTLTYTHTNANGCTNSGTVNITVQDLTAIATLQNDTALCVGGPPVALGHAPPGGTWVGAAPGGVFTPAAVGSYTVTYSVGSGTCLTSDAMQVQVLPGPVINAMPSFSRCAGDAPVALMALPAGGSWAGAGVSGPPYQFDPAVVAPGSYPLVYSYTDGTGCAATATITATVNALPAVNAGPALTFCDQPVPQTLSGIPAGGTWSAGWMNVTPQGVLTPGGVGSDVLTYTYTDANGCTASDQTSVDVVAVDEAADAGPDAAYCAGLAPVQLAGTPAGGTWSGGPVSAGGLFTPSQAGVFVLTYSVGSNTCLTTDQATITVNALPMVDAGTDLSLCADAPPIALAALPSGGAWNGPGMDLVSGLFTPAMAQIGANVLTYTYVDPATGCSNSATKTITVNPLPTASFTHAPVGCAGTGVAFTNTSTGATGWQWSFGDGGSSTAQHPSHVYAVAGNYPVLLTVFTGAGCSAAASGSIGIWDVPLASLALSADTGCGPLIVAFTNNSAGAGLQYLWDFGGLGTSALHTPAPFIFPPDPLGLVQHTVTLTATNLCGMSTASAPVVVMPVPTAEFGPDVNVHCALADVPFGNASFGAPDSFLWDFGDGSTSTSGAPVVTHAYGVLPDEADYTVTLVVSNACGSDTTQHVITILPNQVTAFFNTDPVQGCAPLTVSFTEYCSGDTALYWDLGDGNVSLLPDPVHTYTLPGTYTVELSAFGCGFDQFAIDVTVHPAPQPAFTVQPAQTCAGLDFTFVNTTPGIAGSLWDFGDGTSSTLTSPQHAFASAGTYTVTLTATSAVNGCSASIAQSITALETPVAAFTPQPGNGCVALDVAFQNNSQNAQFYTWDFGDGNTSAQAEPFHTYPVAGTYTVTMIAQHVGGCADTMQVQVVAHPLPVSSFSLMPAQSCTAPVTVQATNASVGAVGYVWDLGNGTTSMLNQPTVTFDAAGTYTVQLTAMNQFGCTHTSSQQFTVHPTPVAAFSTAPNPGCTGRPVVFTNSSINANAFLWWFGDGSSSNAASPQHVYAVPGSYSVSLVAVGAGGCTDTLTLADGLIIHPSPVADFTSDTLSTLDNAVRFTDLSQGAASFVWDFGDGTSSDERHPVHLFPGDGGGYTVCLAVANTFGCPDTVCKFISLPEDPGIFAPNAFTPNADGLNDIFLPVLNGWSGWDYRLLIFDRWGEAIAETRDRAKGWDGRSRGRDAPIDVYVWRVVLERMGDAREFMGHVSLIR